MKKSKIFRLFASCWSIKATKSAAVALIEESEDTPLAPKQGNNQPSKEETEDARNTPFIPKSGVHQASKEETEEGRYTPFIGKKGFCQPSGQETKEEETFVVVAKKGYYQPSGEETREAYQALITLVEAQSQVNLPREIVYRVADEVLSVLKTKIIKTPRGKKAEIEKILNPVPDFVFNELVSIAKLITDYYNPPYDHQLIPFVPEEDFYQPKSDDMCTPYKLLLDLVSDQLGVEQPQIVQCVVAHDVLEILKDPSVRNYEKRNLLESWLNRISDDTFDTLLFIGELIKDFDNGKADVAGDGYLDQPSIDQRPEQMVAGFQSDCGGDQMVLDDVNDISFCTDDDELLDPVAGENEP